LLSGGCGYWVFVNLKLDDGLRLEPHYLWQS
jgi:hypothetical protein